tara:strand:- start:4 stop:435 length:432 start_codon:yes stop_codon:yes gene_type:complete
MFNIFKKKNLNVKEQESNFEIELTACVLAYELARSDGNISGNELSILMNEIEAISTKVGKEKDEIFKIIEMYSQDSVSFYEFIQDINNDYSKNEKLDLIYLMWKVAFADNKLDVDEERLIRRLADLINIKDLDVLKLKDKAQN